MNSAPPSARTVLLRDGRTLGFAEYGAPDGKPLLYFHGHPGCRWEARFLAEAASRAQVRLIGIDRPGMGLSTYKPKRRLLDWPDDVVELADRLGIDRFGVVGLSGGGPYVLACAHRIPQRLTACGVIAGVGRIGRGLAFLAQWLPWLMLPMVRRLFRDDERAAKALRRASQRWAEPDRKSLDQAGILEAMAASLTEGLRQGARGPALDGALLGRSWGFKLEEIAFPSIHLWHGERDNQVPVAMGREVARRLPSCKATYYPDDGHISVIARHAEEIVKALSG